MKLSLKSIFEYDFTDKAIIYEVILNACILVANLWQSRSRRKDKFGFLDTLSQNILPMHKQAEHMPISMQNY